MQQENPLWAYLFMGIHCLNFVNGALGALLAIVGIMATISISCNTKMSVVVRILLDVAMVAVCAIVIIGVTIALAQALY